MITILTKYLPATHTKGGRVKAFVPVASGEKKYPSIIIGYHSADGCPHIEATKQLCIRMGWQFEKLVCGDLPDGKAFVFNV